MSTAPWPGGFSKPASDGAMSHKKIPAVDEAAGIFVGRNVYSYSMAKVETIVPFSSRLFGLLTVMPYSPAGLSISVSR